MISKGNPSILSNGISDAQIVQHYLGVTKIPCLIRSPLRVDNKQSFGLYTLDGIKIYFKDYATGEQGGVYDLLERMWNCDYKTACNKVCNDIISNNDNIIINKSTNHISISLKDDSKLYCKTREWQPHDLEYWNAYGITKEWLEYAEVYPISHKIIVKNNRTYTFSTDKYAYAFVERKEGNITLKIYQPFNKNYKWSNKHDKSVISLWTKIPKTGERLFICSSLKDALCVWANTCIPAIAPQGEGYGISETAVNELKKRYSKIFILYDNDEAGLKYGKILESKTGFTNIIIPHFEYGKDISDFYKIKGKKQFINLIKNLIT